MNELQVIEKALQGAKCRKAEIDFPLDEVKEKAREISEKYRHAIYTDEMVKTCKEDKAILNKIAKKIDSTALYIDKELSAPIKRFRDEMKEVSNIIKEAAMVVQFKTDKFEEKRKTEKQEQIDLVYNGAIETCNLDQKYIDKIEIKKEYYNVSMTVNKIDKDIKEQIENLKREQEFEKSKYSLIDTKVELYNLKLGLQIGVTAKSLYYLVELDTLEEIDEKVLALVEDQKVVEDENIARIERMAKERAEKEKQEELNRIERENQAKIDKLEAEKQSEIDRQVSIEKAAAKEQMELAEQVTNSTLDFIPMEAEEGSELISRSYELIATKEQFEALDKYLAASGIEVE